MIPIELPARTASVDHLCELLLSVAGRNTGRMQTARRHLRVLSDAFEFISDEQRAVARARIGAIHTKWGPLLWGDKMEPESGSVSPETRVAHWLSRRRYPARLLPVLHRAATRILEGETSISRVQDHAYAKEMNHVLPTVGQDSFTEWMLELRIATKKEKGCYIPGPLCRWWVEELEPSNDRTSTFMACLQQAAEMRFKGRD